MPTETSLKETQNQPDDPCPSASVSNACTGTATNGDDTLGVQVEKTGHASVPTATSTEGIARDSSTDQTQPQNAQNTKVNVPTTTSSSVVSSHASAQPVTLSTRRVLSNVASKPVMCTGPQAISSVVVENKFSTSGANAGGQPSQTGLLPSLQLNRMASLATVTQPPVKSVVMAVPRATTTPQPIAARPRPTLTKSVQLPANFQIPQGMVLIRSDSGQLMLVSQHALAQAQGMVTKNPAVPSPSPTPSQVSAATVTSKVENPAVIKVPPPPSIRTTTVQRTTPVVKMVGAAPIPPAGLISRPIPRPVPQPSPLIIPITRETLENVKKCKNFLVTLIKLTSSGTQSADRAKNVRELVRSLLDGRLEPEEFTDRLYHELKSSPQPGLVAILKKSLTAVRQLTPNPQLFIQQVDQPKPQASTSKTPTPAPTRIPTLIPTLLSPNVMPSTLGTGSAHLTKPTQLVIQQPRGVPVKSNMTASGPSRSDSGQLMLVSQHALAQAQGMVMKNPAVPSPSPTPSQVSAATVTRKVENPAVIKVPPPPSIRTTTVQRTTPVVKMVGAAPIPPAGLISRPIPRPVAQPSPLIIPIKANPPKATPPTITRETLENVKKCKKFLVTLIQLTSSGTQSADRAKNVRELVRSLLDGRLEPEEFTDRLYHELKSSPQPGLVAFLKKSLTAVRQLTPNPQLFIQQVDQPKPQASTSKTPTPAPTRIPTLIPTLLSPNVMPSTLGTGSAHLTKPTQLVIQQPRGVPVKSNMTASGPSRSDSGQLMLVSQHALAQAQGMVMKNPAVPSPSPTPSQVSAATVTRKVENPAVIKVPPPPSIRTTTVQRTTPVVKMVGAAPIPPAGLISRPIPRPVAQPSPLIIPIKANPPKATPPTITRETLENVKKCKKFLVTLIQLTSSGTQSADRAKNVRELVRSLLDGRLEPEEFTDRLYHELKSSPQPGLVAFLKKSLTAVRQLTPNPQLFIQQVDQPKPQASTSKTPTRIPTLLSHRHTFKDTAGFFREEDDINDVVSMAGVNLSKENTSILGTNSAPVGTVVRSCRDEPFLPPALLLTRILHTAEALGVTEVVPDVVSLVSHATEERLRDLLEKVTVVAQHRKMSFKDDFRHTQVSDARSQLRFLEQLERLEKQRRDDEERERLLRFAKSRSNTEDQQLLKQQAIKLQQLEQAQLQYREANLTALAAIGPRRKRPLDFTGNQVVGAGSVLQRADAQMVTRVTLRDLLPCLEQDPPLRHSLTLYKALLR